MDYVLLGVFLGLTLLGVPVAFTLALSVPEKSDSKKEKQVKE